MKKEISDLNVGECVEFYGYGVGVITRIRCILDSFNNPKFIVIAKVGMDERDFSDNDINWKKTNELNNKQMKELKIEVPKGFEIDKEKSTFEKIVFKEIENKLPMSVAEIPNRGWFITTSGVVSNLIYGDSVKKDKNNLSTKERAEAFLALMQLVELRDAWNGDSERHEYLIVIDYKKNNHSSLVSFKTAELRNQFAEQFKDLIETAKELL